MTDHEVLCQVENLAVKTWNGIDGIIANAGAVKPVHDWDISAPDWEWYLNANFKIAYQFATHFIPKLQDSKGAIVFISSIAGLEDIGAPLPYSASKAALTLYAKGLARKLAPDGIRVNTVAPGNIIFEGGNWDNRMQANPEAVQALIKKKVPLQRFGTPEDIGNLVSFLVSERAAFITGSCLIADGGQTNFFI